MRKKGICENCKREDVAIVGKMLCGRCYSAQLGKEGRTREIALSVVRTKETRKYTTKKGYNERRQTCRGGGTGTAGSQGGQIHKGKGVSCKPAAVANPDQLISLPFRTDEEIPLPLETEKKEKRPIEPVPLILSLPFAGRDERLYDKVVEAAELNRRDISQQILYMLEKELVVSGQ